MSNVIEDFLHALEEKQYRLHALMILRDGQVRYASAARPYTLDTPHRLYSAAKSILVLDVLMAMQAGRISPDDRIMKFFPEMRPVSENMEKMRVRDVLGMRTGQETDPFPVILRDIDADLIRAFFETPVEETPGERFRYNNTVPHIVYALCERAMGEPFEELHRRWLSQPLGAPLFAPTNPKGQYNPVVTTASANTFMKYARLFLEEGRLDGRTLIEPDLIRMASACTDQTGLPGNGARYGWQIWGNQFGGYRMDGGWGQFAVILPQERTAVVMLSDMTDCSYALEAFEQILLPGLPSLDAGGAFPELRPLAPAGLGRQNLSLLEGTWTGPGMRLEGLADDGALVLRIETDEGSAIWRIGLSGRFERNTGYKCRPFSIDHSVYGQDKSEVYLSGAFTGPDRFEAVGKCFAEMGETAAVLTVNGDEMTLRFTPQSVHGIAAAQTAEMKEMKLWHSRRNC